jgi:hypothetical protein
VLLSSDATLSAHEVSPFVIDMQNEGRLSDRGQFRTYPSDLEFLLDHHLNKEARARWNLRSTDTVDVAIYAHGGLVDEENAADSARQWVPLLYSNRIFPIFLMWETDLLTTVFNSVEDAVLGEEERRAGGLWSEIRTRIADWKDERIEGLTRTPGSVLWDQMKDNANDISRTDVSGVVKLFDMFKARRRALPDVRLHLIGHSAGAIVHAFLAERALKKNFTIESINLIAPAVRVDTFDARIGAQIGELGVRTLIAHLTDDGERSDPTCSPYGKSLLYLVSRAFEDRIDEPILGMEKHLVPGLVSYEWGTQISRLASPGAAYRPGDPLTVATTHGGLDDDPAVQEAVIRHIKGPDFTGRVQRHTRVLSRRSDDDVDTTASIEEETLERVTRIPARRRSPRRRPSKRRAA